MTKQQAQERAGELYDQGKWLQLAILIAQFGIELIQYLRERIKSKKQNNEEGKSTGQVPERSPESGT